MRGAWIEIIVMGIDTVGRGSLPVRGAWIEIRQKAGNNFVGGVAPRAGSVD